jgi:hypothetical protein
VGNPFGTSVCTKPYLWSCARAGSPFTIVRT